MKIIRDLAALPAALRGGAVAIGNFDGVHRGHAAIVARLLAKANDVGGPAIVLTFDPHPVRLLRPEEAPPPLTWTERKAELLVELGVDWIIAYPTDLKLLGLEPEAFFETIVCQQLAARAVIEGPNFYFGRDRAGNINRMAELCGAAGISLDVVPPVQLNGQIVSSSRVRRELAAGGVDAARNMLTRPYRLRGMVTHGAGRGAKIGFPTANIDAVDTLIPGDGVYAGVGYVDQERWPAAINLGANPTFGEHRQKLEVHLIGRREPLYGKALEIDFLARLRDIQTFSTVEDLKNKLATDVALALQWAAKTNSSDNLDSGNSV